MRLGRARVDVIIAIMKEEIVSGGVVSRASVFVVLFVVVLPVKKPRLSGTAHHDMRHDTNVI